jgi:hypothetical protein
MLEFPTAGESTAGRICRWLEKCPSDLKELEVMIYPGPPEETEPIGGRIWKVSKGDDLAVVAQEIVKHLHLFSDASVVLKAR